MAPTRFSTLCLPLLVLAALFLAACSLADFAYDLAPRLATRYVDDHLQLTNRQEARALELFRERHALHARDELPRYHEFLLRARTALADGAGADEIDALFDSAEALFELGVERTLPAVSEVLADLDRDQVDALDERLRESAERYREELDDDHKGRRLGETLEDMEEWLGSVSDAQRQLLRKELSSMPDTGRQWLEWRMQRNAALIALLQTEPKAEAIQEFLGGYWLRREALAPELAQAHTENRRRYRDMLLKLDATLAPQQRRHLLERLDEYSAMVLDMMPDEVRLATLAEAGNSGDRRMRE